MRFLLETPWLAPYTVGLRAGCWRAWVEAVAAGAAGVVGEGGAGQAAAMAAAAALCRRALAEEGEVGCLWMTV
jgi:hypothetical protein